MVTREMLCKLDRKMQVMFAVFCGRQVIHLVKPEHKEACLKAIEAAEGWIEGRVSREECNAAANAAYAAAANAANATYAYAAAASAAYAASSKEEEVVLEQNRYYDELLNFDKMIEDLLGL